MHDWRERLEVDATRGQGPPHETPSEWIGKDRTPLNGNLGGNFEVLVQLRQHRFAEGKDEQEQGSIPERGEGCVQVLQGNGTLRVAAA